MRTSEFVKHIEQARYRYVSLYRTPVYRNTRYTGGFLGNRSLLLDLIVLLLTGIHVKQDSLSYFRPMSKNTFMGSKCPRKINLILQKTSYDESNHMACHVVNKLLIWAFSNHWGGLVSVQAFETGELGWLRWPAEFFHRQDVSEFIPQTVSSVSGIYPGHPNVQCLLLLPYER